MSLHSSADRSLHDSEPALGATKGEGIIGRVGAALLLGMLVASTAVSASSAATPDSCPQLHIAVLDAGDAGDAIGACVVPRAATPKAGRSCAIVHASASRRKAPP